MASELPQGFVPDGFVPDSAGTAPAPSGPRPFSLRNVLRPYLDQLPMVGGGVGGAAGLLAGGGTTAGLAAVPGALMGAGIGGAAGQGLRELGYAAIGERVPSPASWKDSPEAVQALGRMAGSGTEQMFYQAAGEVPAAGLRLFAKPLAKGAVRPTAKMLAEFADLDLPQEVLSRGIGTPAAATAARQESAREARRMVKNASRSTVTPMRTVTETVRPTGTVAEVAAQTARQNEAVSAIAQAAQKHGYAPQELAALLSNPSPAVQDLAQAHQRGLGPLELASLRTLAENLPGTVTRAVPGKAVREFTYTAQQFVRSPQVARLRRELANSGLPAEARAELDSFFGAWTAQHAGRTSPIKWYKLAQSLQREAKPFYGRGAQGSGQQLASSPNVQAAKAALASAIKEGLGGDIPGLRSQDANTRVLIALERALKRSNNLMLSGRTLLPAFIGDVAARSMGHSGAAEIPAALGAAYLGHVATSPAVLGRAAVAATRPGTQRAARQFPRLFDPVVPPLVRADRDETNR